MTTAEDGDICEPVVRKNRTYEFFKGHDIIFLMFAIIGHWGMIVTHNGRLGVGTVTWGDSLN